MTIDESDRKLFQQAMRGVDPIKRKDRATDQRPKPKRIRPSEVERRRVLEESLNDPRDPDTLGAEPPLTYVASGIQRKVSQKLRRGQVTVQAVLDLHGKSRAQAHESMNYFLADCTKRGLRCVRIIHGKGHRSGPEGPVLKHAVASWLVQRADVLAYTSARPVDGGTGAVYVLLDSGSSTRSS